MIRSVRCGSTVRALSLILVSTALLAACVSFGSFGRETRLQIRPGHQIASRPVSETNYRLGQRQAAYVGQPVVRVRAYQLLITSDRLCLTQNATIEVHALLRSVDVSSQAGQCASIMGRTAIEGEALTVIRAGENVLLVRGDGSLYPRWVSGFPHEPRVLDKLTVDIVPATARFVPTGPVETIDPTAPGYLNYELIYGGTDGRSFTLTYREYTKEDVARTAFFQNLVYDRGSQRIRFRDLEILVHDVTNEAVIFTVLSDTLPR